MTNKKHADEEIIEKVQSDMKCQFNEKTLTAIKKAISFSKEQKEIEMIENLFKKAISFSKEQKGIEMIEKKSELIQQALSQMTGFRLGKWGGSTRELVSSMGLTQEEWNYIKKNAQCDLSEDETEEVDEYFKEQMKNAGAENDRRRNN